MKKEDYVSLITAMMLNKKGFDEYCEAYYHLGFDEGAEEDYFEIVPNKDFKNSNNKFRVGAPTLYEAQKWLWQNHNLLVNAFLKAPFAQPYEFMYCIQDAKDSLDDYANRISEKDYKAYEEALNAGILEALKLI